MQRQVRQLSLALLVAIAGCKKDDAPAPPAAKPAVTPATPGAEETPWTVSIAAKGAITANQTGAAVISVAAKEGFHVNPDYPVAFKVMPSSSVKFAADRVALTASNKSPCAAKAEDTCAAEFELPFTAQAAGAAQLEGTVAFSVCSAEKCLIQKEPLKLALTVN
jgi:hypothetical protein